MSVFRLNSLRFKNQLTKFLFRANIPPWLLSLIQSLPDETQTTLLQLGSKAIMDPWFVSIASVPSALNLVYLPHGIKLLIVLPLLNLKYNNVSPRETNWYETLNSKSLAAMVKRCESAHQNAWEAFNMFAPAVLLCKLQNADKNAVKELCVRFLKLRLLYTFVYVFGFHKFISYFRTVVWFAGVGTVLELYSKALLA